VKGKIKKTTPSPIPRCGIVAKIFSEGGEEYNINNYKILREKINEK